MLDGDIDALRSQYLFAFAHLCNISPPEVDAMRLLDFAQLILGIDAYQDAIKRANEQ